MNVRAIVAALVASSTIPLAGVGCVGVSRAVTQPPRLFVAEEEVAGHKGAACNGDFDVGAGRMPDGAVVLARYHVTTSQPVPLQQVLDLLATYGRRRCADGVRVLRADVADGSEAVIAAEGVAYALPAS